MTYSALIVSFAPLEELPVTVNSVLGWVQENTDHKDIRLHGVERTKKAFRGAFRRLAVPTEGAAPYSHEYQIITHVLYGNDLPADWKRLVICKEVLHVFDGPAERVSTPEAAQKLITAVIAPGELKGAPFLPALNDHFGAFRAMAVLLPRNARHKLQAARERQERTVAEIASFVRLPPHYVDLWLTIGDELEKIYCPDLT